MCWNETSANRRRREVWKGMGKCLPGFRRLHGWLAAILTMFPVLSRAGEAAPSPPLQRELWVPEKNLAEILASHPKAVVLDRKQYEALVRDAGERQAREAIAPPAKAVIRSAAFQGRLAGLAVIADAVLEIDCLADTADGWNEIALPLDAAALGSVKLDDAMALQTAGKEGGASLFVKGRGTRRLELQLFYPVKESPSGSSMVMHCPGAAASAFVLELPDRFTVRSSLPVAGVPSKNAGNTIHTFSLPQQPGPFTLTWRARDISALAGGAVMQTCSYLYQIDPIRITSDLGMVLRSSLARVPAAVTLPLPPEAKVLSVDGPDVLDWSLAEQSVNINFSSADLRETNLRVVLESAATAGPDADPKAPQKAALPFPSITGVHRASGAFAIVASPEVKVRQISTAGLTAQTVSNLPGNAAAQAGFVAGFQFPVLPAPPEIEFQRLQPRFQADLHTQIDLRRDVIQLSRHLRILTKEGEIFSTRLRIPPGEEIVSVALAGGGEPEWQKRDGGVLEIKWPESVKPGAAPAASVLNVETRIEPADWFTFGERPKSLDFADAAVEGAELVTGYVGLDFDERFQVRAANSAGLEPTDAKRLTSIGIPVRGTMTWSRGETFSLGLAVSRRPAEVHGSVMAFALPLLHTCEVEGELSLDVRNSGIRTLIVGAPAGVAEFLRFDSPLISERRLEKLTGEWTLTFHEELRGAPRLRFHLSLPLVKPEVASTASGEEQRFQVALPVLTLPGAGRVSGQWIVEANTDTELIIQAEGLDERDILTTPRLSGYAPRHRIIGAYAWRGGAWKLSLEGVRHAAAPLPGLVIDSLQIASVISTDGQERREVVIDLRSNGEQFFNFTLPAAAKMLSLTVDGAAIKPVANALEKVGENGLRIQLPATIEARPSRIQILYEFAGSAWDSDGKLSLNPPAIDPKIPVLKSNWRLHLPDGYSYRGFEGNLEKEFEIETCSLGREVAAHLGDGVKEVASAIGSRTMVFSAKNAATQSEEAVFLPGGGGGGMTAEALKQAIEQQEKTAEEKRMAMLSLAQKYAITDFSPVAQNGRTEGAAHGVYRSESAAKIEQDTLALEQQLKAIANLKGDRLSASVGQFQVEGPALKAVVPKLQAAKQELESALQNGLGDQNPKIVGLRRQVGEMQAILDGEIESLKKSLDAKVSINRALLKMFKEQQTGEKARAGQTEGAGDYAKAKTEYELEFRKVSELRSQLAVALTDSPLPPASAPAADKDKESTHAPNVRIAAQTASSPLTVPPPSPPPGAPGMLDDNGLAEADRPAEAKGDGVKPAPILLSLRNTKLERLQFDRAPIEDVITYLRAKSIELDQLDPDKPGVNFIFQTSGKPSRPVTIDLRDVTLESAIKQVVEMAGLSYLIESTRVVISDQQSDSLETRVIVVPANFLSMAGDLGSAAATDAAADPFAAENRDKTDGAATQRQADAKTVLSSMGANFEQPQSSAIFIPDSRRLVVTNTKKQLELIEKLVGTAGADANDGSAEGRPGRSLFASSGGVAQAPMKSGLLPLELNLPDAGRSFSFTGNHLPSPISVRYTSWERGMKLAWLWILGGVLLAVMWARRRPLFAGIVFGLVLHFAPQIGGNEIAQPCNGLLLGWMAAVLFFLAVRLAKRIGNWRRVAAALLALASVVLTGPKAGAAETPAKVAPAYDVFVPFDSTKPVADQMPGRYFVDYEAFQRLWKQAKDNRIAASQTEEMNGKTAAWAKLQSGLYQARTEGNRLMVDGILTIHSHGAWAKAPLAFAEASISSLTLDGAAAPLQAGELLLEKPGSHRVEVKLELPLVANWQQATFGVPVASASLLALTLTDMTSRLRINGGVPTVETASADGVVHRTITAAAGNAGRMTIERILSATMTNQAEKLPPAAAVRSILFLSPALERLESSVEFQFPGGDRKEFALDFDASITPLTFEIPNLESWNLKQEGTKRLLEFRLALPVRDKLQISLTGERPGGAVPGKEDFPEVSPAAVRSERSYLLLAVDELEVKPAPAAVHRQTDFPELSGADAGFQRIACFAASGNGVPLAFELARRTLAAEMLADYLYQISPSKLELHAVLGFKAARGQDLLSAAAEVPQGFSVTRVDSDRLQDWWVEGTKLHIRFSGDTPPLTTLLVGLTQPWAQPPASFGLVPLQFDGLQKVKGRAMIAALPDVNVKLQLDQRRVFSREVGLDEQSEEYPAIGKYTVTEPFAAKRAFTFDVPAYQATVALESVAPKYDVRWVLGADVHESWTRMEARCDVEVKAGAPTSVVFELPAGLGEARVLGGDVREVERTTDDARRIVAHRVHFQRPIIRQVEFTIQLEVPHTGEVALPKLDFPGSGLQERFAIVQNSSEGELRVDAAGTSHSEQLAARDVAKVVHFILRNLTQPQYFRLADDWTLRFKLEKLASTGGTKALALHAELLTAVRTSGEMWLRASYRLQNRALQFLPVRLPDGYELISASVSGEPVRADVGKRDGLPVLLVPLIQTKAGDLALDVDLICRKAAAASGMGSDFKLALDDPELPGVTVERTVWKVSLPPGYELKDSGGNMEKVEERAAEQEIVSSMLNEAKSLLSIASSKDNSEAVRAKARRNAQNVVSTVQAARQADAGVKEQIQQLYVQIDQSGAASTPEAPPAAHPAQEARFDQWVWDANSEYVKQRQSQSTVESQKEEQLLTRNLGLNDNILVGNGVLWGKYNPQAPPPPPETPATATPGTPPPVQQPAQMEFNVRNQAVNRLQQADVLDQRVVIDQLKSVEQNRMGQKMQGAAEQAQSQLQQGQQQEASRVDFEQNYQNARSRGGQFTAPQSGKPQSKTTAAEPSGPQPGKDAQKEDSISEAGAVADSVPTDATGLAPQRRLRPAGRVSLPVAVAAAGQLHHFKKVKDRAALEIVAAKGVEQKGRIRAAVWLGACLAVVLVLDRIRSVRRRRKMARGAAAAL